MAIRQRFARKAVKTTATHTAHGAVSKLRREPLRASTLLLVGGIVGLLAGRATARGVSAPDFQQPAPVAG